MKRIVWSIAGSDSSGASGLQCDLRTFDSFNVHGATVVTAVTAQSLSTARHIEVVSSEGIDAQLRALEQEMPPLAVKIGMLGTSDIVRTIAAFFRDKTIPIILDPVFKSTSGTLLLEQEGITALIEELIPCVRVVTPNIPEAEMLTGIEIHTWSDMLRAAQCIRDMGARAVVIKGGHADALYANDFVLDHQGSFCMAGVRSPHTVRGTGCAFASALTAGLSRGEDLRDALVLAKAYITRGIIKAQSCTSGVHRVLHHAAWPVSTKDFPSAYHGKKPSPAEHSFPPLNQGSIGFYPIVPRSSWIELLALQGVKIVQLRIKDLYGHELEEEISQAVMLAKKCSVQLFINDYWELAIKCGAYGVHLGQEDLNNANLNAILKSGLRLGISTHSYFEAAIAQGIRPSYVALGPIFETTCKSMRFGPQGFSRLGEWRNLIDAPLVAIGGLKPEHTLSAQLAGASGVAAISDWLHHEDPMMRVTEWMNSWKDEVLI